MVSHLFKEGSVVYFAGMQLLVPVQMVCSCFVVEETSQARYALLFVV